MNSMAWIRLVLLPTFVALFSACQLPGAPLATLAEIPPRGQGFASPLPAPPPGQPQSPLAYMQPASPLPGAPESRDCVGVAGLDGYQMVRRIETQQTQADGSIQRGVVENLVLVTRTEGQNCNSHMAMAFVDPQTAARDAINESYAVDDFVFEYCAMCSPAVSDVWRVSKRTTGNKARLNEGPGGPMPVDAPAGITPTSLGGLELDQILAQSSVVGEEEMNGFATVHRRSTDRQLLSEPVGWQVGAASNNLLDVTRAQVDTWLTTPDGRLVRLAFQAEGTTQFVGGSGGPLPFALKDEFNFTAVARNTPIVVPSEVLAAVAEQLKALQGE